MPFKMDPRTYTSTYKLGSTIAKIVVKTADKLPVLIGVSEVETKTVLVIYEGWRFKKMRLWLLHYDSPD